MGRVPAVRANALAAWLDEIGEFLLVHCMEKEAVIEIVYETTMDRGFHRLMRIYADTAMDRR